MQDNFDYYIFLYSNNYSKELILGFAKKNKIENFLLINIGKISSTESEFCEPNYKYFSQKIKNYRKFYKYLKKLMNSNKKLLAVIPCTNHFLAGMLIKMSSNNKNIIKIAHVCEGTLNYYNRFTTFTEVLKRLFKKFTSLIFNFPFFLSFGDNLNVVFNDSFIISRDNDINTNAKKISIIEKNNFFEINFDSQFKKDVLILGTHIIEKYNYKNKNNIVFSTNKILDLIKHSNFHYLPHPRSKDFGKFEHKSIYKPLNLEVIKTNLPAEEIVKKLKPHTIIALCGSSLFLELKNGSYNGTMIAWGFNNIYELGSANAKKEAMGLKTVHEKIAHI